MSDLSESLALPTLSASKGSQKQTIAEELSISSHLPVTLDQLLIPKPASTVIFPIRDASAAQYGLKAGDLLIVDRHATPADNQLVIISANDDLIISRLGSHRGHTPFKLPDESENVTNLSIWGVVTYIICKQ